MEAIGEILQRNGEKEGRIFIKYDLYNLILKSFIMTLKELLKTTEAIVVLGGFVGTILIGNSFAIAGAVGYIVLNVPNIYDTIKAKFNEVKDEIL